MANVSMNPPCDYNKIFTINTAKFSKIPSSISLKNNSSTMIQQHGKLENLHLLSLSKQGKLKEARQFLHEMDANNVSVFPESYQSLFETCAKLKSLDDGKSIHNRLRKIESSSSSLSSWIMLMNFVLQMYCDCGSFFDAQNLFDDMLMKKNSLTWNIMISAYAQNGHLNEAFLLFSDMQDQHQPSMAIFITLIRSLTDPSSLKLGKQMHSRLIKSGFGTNIDTSIDTTMLNMYVKCGWLDGAMRIFDQMVEKNTIGFTGLMVGYNQSRKPENTVDLYRTIMIDDDCDLDEFVFSAVLKACSNMKDSNTGRQIHTHVVKLGFKSEVSVGTPLVDFYAKCGDIVAACGAFDQISEPNDVSISALLTGYCQAGMFHDALRLYQTVRSEGGGTLSNSFIYTSVFQACSALADLNTAYQVHADAIKGNRLITRHGESAIVTMYSKCGQLDYAYQAFKLIENPDTVAWTAMISGYAYHGHAREALQLFEKMKKFENNVKPNEVTFIAILTACSHSGLVHEAKRYLDTMRDEYNVDPMIDHYDCMIDVYARAGLLHEALDLINNMPFDPDQMSWKSLLGGCWTHRNLEIGKIAAENILRWDPQDIAPYIVMFNLYTSFEKWEEAAYYRKLLNDRNITKEISCSWITLQGKLHRFVVGDRHHDRTDEIYSKLEEFGDTVSNDDDVFLDGYSLPERKEQLLVHSEKLAISFGFISSVTSSAPVRVFKNLRACKDCHEFAKRVSMITGREIVVRDSSRFHHFKFGKCSCKEYW